MAFFSERVNDVKRALRKLRRGERTTPENLDDIAWLERTLGLKRPLTSYSERSQRRIFQRVREGAISAKEVNKREYQARKQAKERALDEHSMTAAQWRSVEPIRDKLMSYGMDVDPYLDDEFLKEVTEIYGYNYVKAVLTQQLDSTQQYMRGNSAPGNRRWHARGELEEQFGMSKFVMFVRGTDPYYYYHGRKA